jgi:hypothetical protein
MLDQIIHTQLLKLRVVLLQVRLAGLRTGADGLGDVLVVGPRRVGLEEVGTRLVVRRNLEIRKGEEKVR